MESPTRRQVTRDKGFPGSAFRQVRSLAAIVHRLVGRTHRGRASVLRISSELEEAPPIARCAGSDLTILSISHFVPATIRVTVLRSATIADKRKNCIASLFSP